jgi:hypothetical protein
MEFSSEQLRILENVRVAYDAWLQTAKQVPDGRPWLAWKTISGKEYLYQRLDRSGRGQSLGRRSTETEALHEDYRLRMDRREEALSRIKQSEAKLHELARLYRAVYLPMIDGMPGAILREADQRSMLGKAFLVVGTNAFAAYELEAQHRFATGLDSTEDFDLTWAGDSNISMALTEGARAPLLDMLKAVDETFTENTERPFQARNAAGYEVEVLSAPSVQQAYPTSESLRPSALPEQEWLLQGKPIEQVVVDRTNMPARLIVPDPRWMALHKLWLSEKPGRNRLKIKKDRAQGEALLLATVERMPHYPMDHTFRALVPAELKCFLPPAKEQGGKGAA